MNLSPAISGMHASSIRLNTVGHDVANINTPKFEQSRVNQSEGLQGTEVSSITKEKNLTSFSNTKLAEEQTESVIASASYKANSQVVRLQDEMLGTLIDLKK
jgi:flagellar hook protein FlgE